MIKGIFDPIFKLFKPVEDFIYRFYDKDYMIYIVIGGLILLFLLFAFFVFQVVSGWFGQ